jgi:hypothetical protein
LIDNDGGQALPNNQQWQRNPLHKNRKVKNVHRKDEIEQLGGEKGARAITVANSFQTGVRK